MAARRSRAKRRDGLGDFFRAYVEAALFSTSDESDEGGGEPLDRNYGPDDLAPATVRAMLLDATSFYRRNADAIELADVRSRESNAAQAGHDFWLTRNGHGAGFWDGDWPEPEASRLTKAAKGFGETYLYVGDDGQIHGERSRPRSKTRRDRSPRRVSRARSARRAGASSARGRDPTRARTVEGIAAHVAREYARTDLSPFELKRDYGMTPSQAYDVWTSASEAYGPRGRGERWLAKRIETVLARPRGLPAPTRDLSSARDHGPGCGCGCKCNHERKRR